MISPSSSDSLSTHDADLVRFENPAQWQDRLGWRPRISLSEHNLSRIVGGYNLPKGLWQACGLCNTEHGKGYVVATVDALETQIGKDCGLRHLGARFEELERQFTAGLENQDRLKKLRSLVSSREQLLATAHSLISDCREAAALMAAFEKKLKQEPSVESAYRKALAAEGSVYADIQVSIDEFELTGRRFRREVFARIDGIAASKAASPAYRVQDKFLPFIEGLSEDYLKTLSVKQLERLSKEASDLNGLIVDCEGYCRLVQRFAAKRNWVAFASAFNDGRLKTNDRGRRVLQQLIDLGSA